MIDDAPDITQIVVRDLTEATHGNATGLAGADVTTQRVVTQMDWTTTYINIVTSGAIAGGKLPLVADTDQQAIAIAIRGCPRVKSEQARIVRIRDTLELTDIYASVGMIPQIEAHPDMEVVGEPFAANFDDGGALPYFGRWEEEKPIRDAHRHFIVDDEKMALTAGARFSHCLPVRRNVKVTDAVLDSEACVAIDEAENRLHVQKAVMRRLLRSPRSTDPEP